MRLAIEQTCRRPEAETVVPLSYTGFLDVLSMKVRRHSSNGYAIRSDLNEQGFLRSLWLRAPSGEAVGCAVIEKTQELRLPSRRHGRRVSARRRRGQFLGSFRGDNTFGGNCRC
jgi:hypothetical protein